MIEIKDKTKFFQLQTKFKRIPFTQSEGWYDYLVCSGKQMVFFVDSEQEPKIACWGMVQKIPFSSKEILFIEGESFQDDLSEKVFNIFYTDLLNSTYEAIEINSNNTYNIEFEVGVRRSGFKRPFGSFSCPLTIEMDFNQQPNYNRNWKRNVKKAIKEGLKIDEVKNISNQVLEDVVKMFSELAELKQLPYKLEINSLRELLKTDKMRLYIVNDKNNNPIAARIINLNFPYSSDVFAANSLEARNCGATYFIMQRIFETLKEEEFKTFDFGRIPPSSHATDSVYVFKNASRGNKIQYNGEWVHYKSNLIELMMSFYKLFKLKKQRY